MATANTGTYPCYKNQFQVGTKDSDTATTPIANCEEFSVSFDNGVEEWKSFDQEGWTSRLMTAKSISISVKAKRTVGDAGNDLVAGLAFKNGRDCELPFQWTFPDGTTALFPNAVFNIKALGSGASTDVAPLEFDVMSNGKPTVTPAV